MTESISELRKICQATREDQYSQMGWFPKHVTRKISIYFTKPCLKMGVSANQATIISLVFTIIGGAFFILAEPRWWLVGILLCYGYRIFDCVDGEIARYNKSVSLGGELLDDLTHRVTELYIPACMTFGIYNSLNSNIVFVFGFLAVIAFALQPASRLAFLYFSSRLGMATDKMSGPAGVDPSVVKPIIMRYGYLLYKALVSVPGLGFIPQLLVITLIDCFVSPFTILSYTFNARLIYLIVLGPGVLAGFIAVNYYRIAVIGKPNHK
jgi:hypothetical protein